MTKFPKFNEVASITSLEDIESKIFSLQKCLFALKMGLNPIQINVTTDIDENSYSKSHHIIFLKRRLAHLKFQKSILIKHKS